MTQGQWETAVLVVPNDEAKERIALWIDTDVLRHFEKGYQKRLNMALRKIMVAELLYGKTLPLNVLKFPFRHAPVKPLLQNMPNRAYLNHAESIH